MLDALLTSGNLAVRAALVAAVGGPEGRVNAFATLRAVANLGIAVGAGLAGFALAADTQVAYQILVVGNAATYLLSAALVLRLPAYPSTRAAGRPSAPGRPGAARRAVPRGRGGVGGARPALDGADAGGATVAGRPHRRAAG